MYVINDKKIAEKSIKNNKHSLGKNIDPLCLGMAAAGFRGINRLAECTFNYRVSDVDLKDFTLLLFQNY